MYVIIKGTDDNARIHPKGYSTPEEAGRKARKMIDLRLPNQHLRIAKLEFITSIRWN